MDGALFGGLTESFELVWTCPALDPDAIRLVVCVRPSDGPTFSSGPCARLAPRPARRPSPSSSSTMTARGRAGADRARDVLAEIGLPAAVLVEPRQGNCKAYNALWRFALSRFGGIEAVLGIDDDESGDAGLAGRPCRGGGDAAADILGGR